MVLYFKHNIVVVMMIIVVLALYMINPILAQKSLLIPQQNNNNNRKQKLMAEDEETTWIFVEFEWKTSSNIMDSETYDGFIEAIEIDGYNIRDGACLFGNEPVIIGGDVTPSGSQFIYKAAIQATQNPDVDTECTEQIVKDFYTTIKNRDDFKDIDIVVTWNGYKTFKGTTTQCTECPIPLGYLCENGKECYSGVCTKPKELVEQGSDFDVCWLTSEFNSANTIQYNILFVTFVAFVMILANIV